MSRLVDVYPYFKEHGNVNFLVMKRSSDVMYSGQWRMVGGKVGDDETATEAARRELNEETGQSPVLFWAVPSISQFYDPKLDKIR